MKTKFILGSMVLTVAFAACSNEELATIDSNIQSNMIELNENFMIGVAGENNLESRTHWDFNDAKTALVNVYAPVYTTSTGNNKLGAANVVAPTIGLCWIGQTLGDKVYTNYEFIHNGWLGKAQSAASFDVCDDANLLNGWLYSELSTDVTEEGVEIVAPTGVNKTYGSTTLKQSEMNYNSGVYKTENKAIFGGQYIAYYPYNPDFKDAGTIPAKSKVEFTLAPDKIEDMSVSDNTFRYTNVATIAGGAKAQGFGFNNLSGIIRIQLESKSTTEGLSRNIEKVLLYSASAGFLKEVRLSASAIAQGKTGANLYFSFADNNHRP